MFGFDERYAMFDITPVDNQFILEYMPDAKGDYVKVFLYGLMRCYHPEEDMNLDRMSHELNMTQDEITAAFRYWERKRLVRRVSDQPPVWKYVNSKQILAGPADEPADSDYEDFCKAIYEAFDHVRRLHGSELSTIFEWHESSLQLPTEVIIMLLNHMIQVKGRNFRIRDAEKTAVHMAEENIRTVEAAEAFFSRDEQAYAGARKILKLLGKNYAPSEAQVNLYRKWNREWLFSHDAIEAAAELTAKGDPSFGYLDGILNSLRQEAAAEGETITPEAVRRSSQRADGLKEILKDLGKGEINRQNLRLYDRMLALYPQDVIRIAARECGHNGKETEDVLKLLESWKDKGLDSRQDIENYVHSFHDQTAFIRELHRLWGTDEKRIGKADRELAAKWENEMAFSRELILSAAAFAAQAKQPMSYLDKILEEYRKKGITTPEQARKEHGTVRPAAAGGPKGKTVNAQNYTQRDYTDVQEQLMEAQRKRIEERMRRNGGESDA